MSGLERALTRLLHDRAALDAFAAGHYADPTLGDAERALLSALDPGELAAIAGRIRAELRERRHVGSGNLLDAYPRTIAAYRALQPDDVELEDLLARFTASRPFDDYREIPYAGHGRSLEESFFLFCEDAGIGSPELRESEFLHAVVRALAVNPRPCFSIPHCVKVRTNAYIAATRRGTPPLLFAAVHGRFVTGPITPFLRDLVLLESAPSRIAECHGVDERTLQAALAELDALGFGA